MFRSGVRPPVCVSRLYSNVNRARSVLFLTSIGHAAHTQRDSPGGSTQRGQRTFSRIRKTDVLVVSIYLVANRADQWHEHIDIKFKENGAGFPSRVTGRHRHTNISISHRRRGGGGTRVRPSLARSCCIHWSKFSTPRILRLKLLKPMACL